jgi:hypothetical protein
MRVGFAEDMRPEQNVSGLSWRMTGIGREKWESLPTQGHEEMLSNLFTSFLPVFRQGMSELNSPAARKVFRQCADMLPGPKSLFGSSEESWQN